MKRTLFQAILLPALAVAIAMLLPCLTLNAAPEDAAWQTELESWRAQRATGLQAPEGWLSLIGLAHPKFREELTSFAKSITLI